jgi:hypothetical protein
MTGPQLVSLVSFRMLEVGEVSTGVVTEDDQRLMLRLTVPMLAFEHVEDAAQIFYFDSEEPEEAVARLRAFGFSDQFIAVYESARLNGLQYLIFDRDA